jgi:hypothetical protein
MHLVLDLADKYPRDDHLQRQPLSTWKLERFVGNCSAFCAERN